MKCPHCKKEIRVNTKYCPHCGYQINHKTQTSVQRLGIVLLVIAILLPVVTFFYTSYLLLDSSSTQKQQAYTLEGIKSTRNIQTLYQFEDLDSFNKTITNAQLFITPINEYIEQLEKKYQVKLSTQYKIVVLSNNDVHVELMMKGKINSQTTLEITRRYSRTKQFDEITTLLKKEGCQDFQSLQMLEQKERLIKMTSKKSYQELIRLFKGKEETFNKQKSRITHYGMGVYRANDSLVIEKKGKEFVSIYEQFKEGKYELSRY